LYSEVKELCCLRTQPCSDYVFHLFILLNFWPRDVSLNAITNGNCQEGGLVCAPDGLKLPSRNVATTAVLLSRCVLLHFCAVSRCYMSATLVFCSELDVQTFSVFHNTLQCLWWSLMCKITQKNPLSIPVYSCHDFLVADVLNFFFVGE